MLKDIAYVKDKYGEEMAHFVRDNLSSILETDGLLMSLLDTNFAPNKFLYKDLLSNDLLFDFKNYLNSLIYNEEIMVQTDKTPFELLDEAGYILYECKNINEIERFRNYYQKDEELCTFKGNRLKSNYVFFALKKNLYSIVRSPNPKRDDLYGTSVISIQFSKGDVNTLSIKNRYNHTVKNPDATFSNNLEKIIPGLTDSFSKYYHLNIISNKNKFDITHLDYIQAEDAKFYPYNYEINNIYYGPNNIIIDNGRLIDKYSDKSRFMVLDYFIIDLSKKNIFLYDQSINDYFVNSFNNIQKISICKTGKGKKIDIINDNALIVIEIDKQNRIISYENKKQLLIENNFLYFNRVLKEIDIENVIYIGNNFLYKNEELKSIYLPNIKEIENNFLYNNINLDNIRVENIEYIGDNFLYKNKNIYNINLKHVNHIGNGFMIGNNNIENLNLENVIYIGNKFLWENKKIRSIKLNEVREIGNDFLTKNEVLEYIYAPKLEIVGNDFLYSNLYLKRIELDKLREVGNNFLSKNNMLISIYLPNVLKIGDCFLLNNNSLESIKLSKVQEIGMNFMYYNIDLKSINLDNIKKIGNYFLYHNQEIREFITPSLEVIWDYFMYDNQKLSVFDCHNMKSIGNYFLFNNLNLNNICLNNLIDIGDRFMYNSQNLMGFEALKLNTVGDDFLYRNIGLKHYKVPNLNEKGINYLYSNPYFRHKIKSLKIS